MLNEDQRAYKRLQASPGQALFEAHWLRAVFIHYYINAELLQKHIPYPLDTLNGDAILSFVLFRQEHLHFKNNHDLSFLLKPIASHNFCNLRTYVKVENEPGIFFLKEWIPNAIAQKLGPHSFGLPYALGNVTLNHIDLHAASARVATEYGALDYRGSCQESWHQADDELSYFASERYTAFTKRGAAQRCFRIWHQPWLLSRFYFDYLDDTLLQGVDSAFSDARLAGAFYSPGVYNVQITRPLGLKTIRELALSGL